MSQPVLQVDELTISVPAADGTQLPLVSDLTFSIGAGERVALVGESGSGKSVTARALLRLDPSLRLRGSIRLRDRDLLTLTDAQLATVRGRQISMVFQDPLSALHPTRTIGDQVAEPLLVHGVGRREARRRARAMLDELGIADAARRMRAYPHEFSGGMRQRVVMAMALVAEPEVLIADEPTTALDVRVQRQVLDLLERVAAERSLAVLLITHDVGIVAGFADRVLVMYAGRLVEQAPVVDAFARPAHPYTSGLLAAVPRIDAPPGRLVALPGIAPGAADRPSGCAFHPRCGRAFEPCVSTLPPALQAGPDHVAACHLLTRAEEAVS